MANRAGDMGTDYALGKKMAAKYDTATETEVLRWIQQVTGDSINPTARSVQAALKDGVVLIKLVNFVCTSQISMTTSDCPHMSIVTSTYVGLECIRVCRQAAPMLFLVTVWPTFAP
jgi:hypothetical protein